MKRLCLVMLIMSFITSSAFASTTWNHQVGQWNEAHRWDNGIPIGDTEIKIKASDSVCVLSSSQVWSDLSYNRFRVYQGATLMITDGATLDGPGWMRAGYDGTGTVYQTGGTLKLQKGKDSSKLVIGDDDGSDGYYTISGGTLTYDIADGGGQLTIGDRGGVGKFTVFGGGSVIEMGSLHVGGREAGRGADGTLKFAIDESGLTAIEVGDVYLDPDGDSGVANLVFGLVGVGDADLAAEYLLVDNTGSNAVNGIFDSMPQWTPVTLDTTVYYLTYTGGTGNDIMLVPEPATLILLGLGSLIAVRRRKK